MTCLLDVLSVQLQGLFDQGSGGRKAPGAGQQQAKPTGSGAKAQPFVNMFLKPPQNDSRMSRHVSREEEAFEKMRSQFAKIRQQREQERKEKSERWDLL